jgi:hypothetical protein
MTDIDQALEKAAFAASGLPFEPGYLQSLENERVIFALSSKTGIPHEELRRRLQARTENHRMARMAADP